MFYALELLQISPDLTEKILLAVIPSMVTGAVGFFAAWKLNQSQIEKLKAEIRKTDIDTDLAVIKNQDYWMNKFQIGLRESIKLEEENSDFRLFTRRAMKFFMKIRKKLNPTEDDRLIDELNELELENDAILIKARE